MIEAQVIPSVDGAEISLALTVYITPEMSTVLDLTLSPSDWDKLCSEIIDKCKHPEKGAGQAYIIENAKLRPDAPPRMN